MTNKLGDDKLKNPFSSSMGSSFYVYIVMGFCVNQTICIKSTFNICWTHDINEVDAEIEATTSRETFAI